MNDTTSRREFVLTGAAATATALLTCIASASERSKDSAQALLAGLEERSGGRLGLWAIDTSSGAEIRHRADERFPVCSTFKVLLAAGILQRSTKEEGLLQQQIRYGKDDLVTHAPITEKRLESGMSVAELCAAAIQYSDNTAANLLMKILGGPEAVTAFARSIGNEDFRLDRWETDLNAAVPGDLRDTGSPASMGRSLQALTLGDALPASQRDQLNEWLLGNTTGAKRIRAATPPGWKVGDKTGSGDYGTANDIAVLWPPSRKPMVLAIYHTQAEQNAKWRDDVISAAASIVIDAFAPSPR